MTITKRALITGITGQDGSYLSEFLLEKGYEVHGIIRRTSTFNTDRIDHIYQDPHDQQAQLFLHYGDLTDGTTLRRILEEVKPVEIYNLGAQSHVRVSFDSPEYTVDSVGMGTLRLLEAIRDYQQRTGIEVRFYQAGSSEMFGKVQEIPQSEDTPFYPRSPYACAKVYAHWQTLNYRESYGLFACNGILFNHECVTAETPVMIRRGGLMDIVPIEAIVPYGTDGQHRYTTDLAPAERFEVWDATGWAEVTCMTATWNGDQSKQVHRIAAPGAVYQATSDHVVFVNPAGQPHERPAGEVKVGDTLALIDLPQPTEQMDLTLTEAWLLGVVAAAGEMGDAGEVQIKVSGEHLDEAVLDRVAVSWRKIAGGDNAGEDRAVGDRRGKTMRLFGNPDYGCYLKQMFYGRSRHKRIPKRVLNAGYAERLAFLQGFSAGEGSPNLSGTDRFQGFTTSSAVMAAGLYWMAIATLHQPVRLEVQDGAGQASSYHICLLALEDQRDEGQEVNPCLSTVSTAQPIAYDGWLFDLATTSGTFHAGVGQGWIHNSPRRGETFVTRKITRAIARIVAGQQNKLYLGNLDAKRDWGYAKDYVRAMWLMLQQPEPDDYVVATGETHSVREFLEIAFGYANLTWQDYVEFDQRYLRPAEVELLIGDPAKAKRQLGWEPSITFEELVALMVDADLQALGLGNGGQNGSADLAFLRRSPSEFV